MTVSSTTRRVGPFNGNDVTTAFPFTIKVFTTADIELTHEDADGVQTVLVLDSDYSVSLNADQDNNPGGTITYPVSGSPLATGERLLGIGALEYEQSTDITNLGNFNAQVHEDAFDRQVILTQQLEERADRAITFPVGDTASTALPVAAVRALKTLSFDASGNPVATLPSDAEAAAAASAAAAEASAVAAAASESAAADYARRRAVFLLTCGQSNGQCQLPSHSTEQIDGMLTFSGGQQTTQFSDYIATNAFYQNFEHFASLVPFKEGVLGEGWGTGVGLHLMQEPGVECVLHFSASIGGASYVTLSEGSAAWGDMMSALIQGVKLLQARGYDLDEIEPVTQWVQGEAEANGLLTLGNEGCTTAQYQQILTNLRTSLNRAWSIALGRTISPTIYLWPILATKLDAVKSASVQKAQLDGSNTISGYVLTTNPCQFLTDMNGDLVHYAGLGKRLMAEAHGLIMRKARAGEAWKPLQILTATRVGAVLTVTFNKDIAIDTATFAEVSAVTYPKQKYGFQFFDDAAELTVSGVTVAGKVATVTLGSVPAGAVKSLSMSQHHAAAGTPANVMARSNIRATTAIGVASNGTTIYDFAVPQAITVT